MLRPIPLRALIDTATHSALVQGTRGKTYTPNIVLGNVLVQNAKKRAMSDGNLITTSSATLFYDCVNSTGDPTFKIGDRITYTDGHGNNQIKHIQDIVEAKTTEGIHHYEVMLL